MGMSTSTDLRRALRHNSALTPRQLRAARTRARALSPWRIALKLCSIPFIFVSVAVSVYIRTSEYEPPQALAHLIARVDCDRARAVGLAPAYRGGLGYHARNDADGNGVACEQGNRLAAAVVDRDTVTTSAPKAPVRMVGGAKFVTP